MLEGPLELAFVGDTLVRLAGALEPISVLAGLLGQKPHDLVCAGHRVPGQAGYESDRLSDRVSMQIQVRTSCLGADPAGIGSILRDVPEGRPQGPRSRVMSQAETKKPGAMNAGLQSCVLSRAYAAWRFEAASLPLSVTTS